MTPKSYNILGWFFFTLGLLIFIYWAYRDQRSPTGSKQTFVWTVFGAILLYLIVGIYTFTGIRIIPQSDDPSFGELRPKGPKHFSLSATAGLAS